MKRNIAYVKPQDPTFLAKLKAQIGYQEREDVLDAKRQRPEDHGDTSGGDDDDYQREDEQPQYVTPDGRDELPQELVKQITATENTEEPKADLEQRIVFKAKPSKKAAPEEASTKGASQTRSVVVGPSNKKNSSSSGSKVTEKDSKKSKRVQPKLSFDPEDEEEED